MEHVEARLEKKEVRRPIGTVQTDIDEHYVSLVLRYIYICT